MSLFTEALEGLLDKTNLFNREEWGEVLFIKVINNPVPEKTGEQRIAEWLSEVTCPKGHDINMIYTVLENSSDIPPEPLEKFREMANLPARKVSKFGKLMLPNVWAYMKRPIFCDLANRLAKLTTEEQEALLDAEFPDEQNAGRTQPGT